MTPDDAPALMVHGDKDAQVSIEHSRNMIPLFEKAKVPVKLVTVEGAGHGFIPQQTREVMAPAVMDWFGKRPAK